MTTLLAPSLRVDANAAPRPSVTASVIASDADLVRHRAEWERLFTPAAHEPSVSWEWMHALTRSHYQPKDRFALVRIARGAETIGFVPLVARRLIVMRVPITLLTTLDEGHGTHSDLAMARMDRDTARAFFTALGQLEFRWDVFRMSRLLDGHPLLTLAAEPRRTRGLSAAHVRAGDASYFLALPDTYEQYLSERSAKFRNHLKRTERRIESMDGVAVVEQSSAADVDLGYEWLMQVERASWKQAHGTAITAVSRQLHFYRELCLGAAAAGRLHLQFLTIRNQPVAYNLGYVAGDCYSYLKTSFAEAFRTAGVATYLRARLVESLIARGLRSLDFPAEPYEWERQWTTTVRWHKVLTIYRSSMAGRAMGLLDRVRHRHPANASQVAHADPRAHRAPAPDSAKEPADG